MAKVTIHLESSSLKVLKKTAKLAKVSVSTVANVLLSLYVVTHRKSR